MKKIDATDAARVELMLGELRLPGIKMVWAELAARADKEGWPAARFLAALAEYEVAERSRRRIARNMSDARLPVGKTIATFDFAAVPMVSKAQVMALAAGEGWLAGGANLLMFGPPGTGIGKRRCKTRQVQSARSRRPCLRQQGPGGNQRIVRVDRRPLRTPLDADHGQPALRRMGKGLSRPGHDAGGNRPPRAPRHHSGNERRELSPQDRHRTQTSARTTGRKSNNKIQF